MKQKVLAFYTEKSKIFSSSELASIAENMILSEDERQFGVYLFQLANGKTEDLFETAEELFENYEMSEAIGRHVDATGEISRRKDRKTRERQATSTTGLSKSRRRQIARKAAKTKRANKGDSMRAQRKRRRAIKKRKALGLDSK
ncbi:MAG: prohead core protein [Bacilli bacterium]